MSDNSPTPTAIPTPQDCITAIVASGGNARLASERVHVTPEQLTAIIASDPQAIDSLAAQLRTLQVLNTLETYHATRNFYMAKLSEMDSDDVRKAYQGLGELLAKLTDDHTTTANINITEQVVRMLPVPVRDALAKLAPHALAAPNADLEAVEGEYSTQPRNGNGFDA